MYSVTGRIHQIKQPRGGYLPIARFQVRTLEDAHTLAPKENLHPTVVGLAVDYLTAPAVAAAEDVFQVALEGARRARSRGRRCPDRGQRVPLPAFMGWMTAPSKAPANLVTFDVWKRSTFNAFCCPPCRGHQPGRRHP